MGFDHAYGSSEAYFGEAPDPLVERHFADLRERTIDQPGAPRTLLDVGAGQGRNCLALARAGISVDAIDPSATAMQALAAVAAREGLSLRALCTDFEQHQAPAGGYGAVLLLGLLPLLRRAQLRLLLAQLDGWMAAPCLLLVTAFTTADPAFERHQRDWQSLGDNSFFDGQQVRSYFEPGQLPELFSGCKQVDYREIYGPEHRHADGPVHRHARAEGVFLRL